MYLKRNFLTSLLAKYDVPSIHKPSRLVKNRVWSKYEEKAEDSGHVCFLYTVFQKKLHPFYFCNNFVDPGLTCIIFGSDTPEQNFNKTCIVFPTTPIFCAPTIPFKTSKLSD